MNILITGANGQLGNGMRLISSSSPHRFVFTDINRIEGFETTYLDITDLDAVMRMVATESIDVIVNCAAYNNVEKAEEDQEACSRLNVKAPENLAVAMKETGGLIVHISSDYVFGASDHNTPFSEDMETAPANVYGRTKSEGEKAVMAIGGNHVIIRTAWLYSEFGRNFVKTMLELTSTKPDLNVVFDQTGTPTYALDLAEAIHVILNDYASHVISTGQKRAEKSAYPKSGIYHFSNEGVCSWFDFTRMIAEYAGNSGCNIKPCHSDEFPSKVKRPAYSVLDKTKIKKTFGLNIPYWTESLKKCISALQSHPTVTLSHPIVILSHPIVILSEAKDL